MKQKIINKMSHIILLFIFLLGNYAVCYAGYERAVRKHIAIGDELYKQRRIIEAITEWEVVLAIDPDSAKASERIKRAETYLAGISKIKEKRNNPQEIKETIEYSSYPVMVRKPKTKGPIDSIKAEILEIERVGGRVTQIIMAAGAAKKIRTGLEGIIVEPNGSPVGVFQIKLVDQDKSLAEVEGLSRDISDYAVAIINRSR
ncbi:hypothetical protein KAR34_00235 [bacterium]|nr:hypothetical protein [bacterium]